MTIYTTCANAVPLGQAIHYLMARNPSPAFGGFAIRDNQIETSWAEDSKMRDAYYDIAQELAAVLLSLGWTPPTCPQERSAAQLTEALNRPLPR